MSKWIKSLAKVNIKAVGEIIDLVAENKKLKAKLAKGQESFELVLDNAVADKAAINSLCDALDEASAARNRGVSCREADEWAALAKQHKQSNEDV